MTRKRYNDNLGSFIINSVVFFLPTTRDTYDSTNVHTYTLWNYYSNLVTPLIRF
jgi:hypothetical protein